MENIITSKDIIQVKICSVNGIYDNLIINNNSVIQTTEDLQSDFLKNNLDCGDCITISRCLLLRFSGIFTHYLIKELYISNNYRKNFIKRTMKNNSRQIEIKMEEPMKHILDYNWNKRTTYMVLERSEVDNALSWLSTLGGAFSALGDYFPSAADMAGKISLRQFQLALRLGDETIQSRCRLFMSLSLIQKGKLKSARKIVLNEYKLAKCNIIKDHRLVKMCLGIWAKLSYEWEKRKNMKILD